MTQYTTLTTHMYSNKRLKPRGTSLRCRQLKSRPSCFRSRSGPHLSFVPFRSFMLASLLYQAKVACARKKLESIAFTGQVRRVGVSRAGQFLQLADFDDVGCSKPLKLKYDEHFENDEGEDAEITD